MKKEEQGFIKEVCGEKIWVKETTIFRGSPITWPAGIILFMILVPVIYSTTTISDTLVRAVGSGFFSALIAMGVALILSVWDIGSKNTPAYKLFVGDEWGGNMGKETRTFEKTTPEEDQITLCKYAKELETAIIDRNRRAEELDNMAKKCK